VLGNLRKMVEDVGTSPAMLFYLDNNSNQVAGPNENYARELFELHTLGADNYSGVLDPAHPGTAKFIATKLARRLISNQPPAETVNRAAEVFLSQANAPDQLAKVVRAIVLSDGFRATWAEKIKRPFEATVSMLRAIDVDFTRLPGKFYSVYEQMGQPLFGHPAPNGHGDFRRNWSGTTATLYRWKLAKALAENQLNQEDVQVRVDLVAQTPPDVRSANAAAICAPTRSRKRRCVVCGAATAGCTRRACRRFRRSTRFSERTHLAISRRTERIIRTAASDRT
jgi:uncharacterized protein (DUF1800 family)